MQKPETFVDFYELLQLSPNADPAAIHVMHYHLTEKYHPDNKTTGDMQKHRAVLHAYKVLGSPESRAQYDAEYQRHKQASSPVGAPPAVAQPDGGIEMERARRLGILYLLYQRRMKDMTRPNMNMRDFEAILGCPKETLEFTLWYLKENDCLRPGDNGAYSISAKGVELYERTAMESQDLVVLPSPGKTKAISPAR
jgi:curved DNA-binding protein CbpA